MTDLFQKKTKKEMLLEFVREKKYAKSHEITEWGLKNYLNSAERRMRELSQEGKVRRLNKVEKQFRFGDIREDVWVSLIC